MAPPVSKKGGLLPDQLGDFQIVKSPILFVAGFVLVYTMVSCARRNHGNVNFSFMAGFLPLLVISVQKAKESRATVQDAELLDDPNSSDEHLVEVWVLVDGKPTFRDRGALALEATASCSAATGRPLRSEAKT